MVRCHFENEGYRSIGHLRKVYYEDLDLFINYVQARFSLIADGYANYQVDELSFSYFVTLGKENDKERELLKNLTNNKSKPKHRFTNINLPISMNPSDYGEIISTEKFDDYTRHIVSSNIRTFCIDVYQDFNKCRLLGGADLEWKDSYYEKTRDPRSFKREIKKSTIYFMDGMIVLRKQILPAKSFSIPKAEKKIDLKYSVF